MVSMRRLVYMHMTYPPTPPEMVFASQAGRIFVVWLYSYLSRQGRSQIRGWPPRAAWHVQTESVHMSVDSDRIDRVYKLRMLTARRRFVYMNDRYAYSFNESMPRTLSLYIASTPRFKAYFRTYRKLVASRRPWHDVRLQAVTAYARA